MNEFTAKKGLRSVRKIEELPEGTVYYSKEEEWKSRCSCEEYTRLYDKDLNVLEDVNVLSLDAIDGLQRVVSEKRKDDVIYQAYDLEEIAGTGFYKVCKNEDTMKCLETMMGNMKKDKLQKHM